jgi:mevalonate pyrophosphate decarboxylase
LAALNLPVIQASPDKSPTFIGVWLYVRPASRDNNNKQGNYLPKYIELSIAEAGRNFRGRYRARYQVTDKAISPVVEFDFKIAPTQPTADLPWESVSGASGFVKLSQESDDLLKVNWYATRLSESLSLASGSATLKRLRTH